MSNNQTIVGVDIGGTKINIGKIRDGRIIKEIGLPTNSERPEKEIVKDLIKGIKEITDEHTIGIGIGVPGLLDEKKGIIYNLINIPSWHEVNLKSEIETAMNLPVYIANDANCFVLGEKVFGKCKQFSNIVGITLGTGTGAGIIINNKIYSGVFSLAGEIGSIPYLDQTYEFYCSGKFFTRCYGIGAKEIYERAEANDPKSLDILTEFGKHVGNLIKTVILTYGPEAIILGGSISNAYKFFKKAIDESVAEFPHKSFLGKLQIMDFTGEKIPLMGAAALVLNNSK